MKIWFEGEAEDFARVFGIVDPEILFEKITNIEGKINILADRAETEFEKERKREEAMQVDLTELKDAVAEQKTVDDSIRVLVDQISDKLAEMSQQPTVNPQDLLDLASSIRNNNAEIRAKVVENT